MVTASGPYTVVDLERMREETDERYELIDGEVFEVPSPDVDHQRIIVRLAHHFFVHVEMAGLGLVFVAPMDVRFSELRDVQPDLILTLPGDGAELLRPRIAGVPTLVGEIVSPSSRVHDRRRKRALYADVGVPEYLLFDPPTRGIVALTDPADGDYRAETTFAADGMLRLASIPGVEMPVAALFPPPVLGK